MVDVEQLRIWDDPGETICAEAAAEIERLRAALAKIADPDISWGHMKLIARETIADEQYAAKEKDDA